MDESDDTPLNDGQNVQADDDRNKDTGDGDNGRLADDKELTENINEGGVEELSEPEIRWFSKYR